MSQGIHVKILLLPK